MGAPIRGSNIGLGGGGFETDWKEIKGRVDINRGTRVVRNVGGPIGYV